MRLGRVAGVSDTGRRRRNNEDSYVCKPPLFAVADGVGGAQAGELASRLAAAALREEPASSALPAEERVVELIQEANRRVYVRSSQDEAVSGMSTTMTVALVEDGRVSIGHVGDSRAYLVRNGRLDQVTEDHSLVAELMRDGELSPEEAESHPQRSVITRAVGTDPDVDVDIFLVEARSGDVFLLATDGLTDMVRDAEILEIVQDNRSDLDAAAKALVRAANRGGGQDNITVVAFEIAGAEDSGATVENVTPRLRDEDARDEVDEDTLTESDGVPALDGVPAASPASAPAPARRRRRGGLLVLVALLVLAAAAVAGIWGLSRAHFIGADKGGQVAVYQGLPYDITHGIRLYRAVYVSPLLAAQLTRAERRRLFDHHLRSNGSARATLKAYEQQVVR